MDEENDSPRSSRPHYPEIEESFGSYGKYQPKTIKSEDVKISLINPIINNGLRNYVMYTVRGDDSQGNFEAHRRYKDFKALRGVLDKQWPGCLIPQIPPKQSIGNLDQDFIEIRRKLLEVFLKRIVRYSFIHQSEVFQHFLRGPQEFHKSIGNYGKVSYSQLAQVYRTNFFEFSNYLAKEENQKQLEDANRKFLAGLFDLENFEGKCKMTVDYFGYYEKELLGLITDMKNVNKFYLADSREINILPRETKENPYETVLDWVRTEILDIRAIIEAIGKISECQNSKRKLEEKIDSERRSLLKLQMGKKGLLQMMSKKPKEHYIDRSSKEVSKIDEELQSLDKIINIITGKLLNHDIPSFKEGKAHIYEVTIKKVTIDSAQVLEYLISQTQQIQDILN